MTIEQAEDLTELVELCASTARQGLTATRDAMRTPMRRNAQAYVKEMHALSADLLRHLEIAEAARRRGCTETAEEGYHRAILLMAELRSRAGSRARLSAAGMA